MLTVALKLCKIFEIYGQKVESTRNSNFGDYLGEIWRLGDVFQNQEVLESHRLSGRVDSSDSPFPHPAIVPPVPLLQICLPCKLFTRTIFKMHVWDLANKNCWE